MIYIGARATAAVAGSGLRAFQASAVRVSGLRVCACVRACVRVRGLTTIETPNATQSKR
jgi:hypothetical protein